MRGLAGVALVAGAMLLIRQLGGPQAIDAPGTALALGFTLVVALVTGELLRRFRLPRLTGYLLFGLLVGPYLGNVITEPMARQLQTVNGIATTMIALIAGLTLNFERLERRAAGVIRLTLVTIAVAMGALLVVVWLAWPWLPIAPDAIGAAKLAMSALLVTIVISFSPTMTAAVIVETGSRGRLSDLVLAMVVIADLVVLVLFSLLMQFARFVLGETADVNVLVRLLWEIGGAVAFGSLMGALFALYLRYVAREVTLVLLATCVVLSQVGVTQQFEPLLAAMAAGIVIANVAVAQGDALKAAIQGAALPVLVVFFVSVGTSLRLDTLLEAGFVAAALGAVRIGLIRLGVATGVKAAGIHRETGSYVWMGLISQAGITLGLGSALAAEFPTWGTQLQMMLVALIAIDELIGPTLFRAGLAYAGDVDEAAPRPLIVVSNREPYLHNFDESGLIRSAAATGGVAVALDALMRERGGTWIARESFVPASTALDRSGRIRCLLRRVCQRRALAPVPSGRRAPPISDRRLGGLRAGERSVCRGHRRGAAVGRGAGFHSGLPSRTRCAAVARSAAVGAHGPLLAHPLALSRPLAHLSVAPRDSGGSAGQRSAGVPGRTRSTQFHPGCRRRTGG
jgi:Kef-type K+ transport system membrane component KefB